MYSTARNRMPLLPLPRPWLRAPEPREPAVHGLREDGREDERPSGPARRSALRRGALRLLGRPIVLLAVFLAPGVLRWPEDAGHAAPHRPGSRFVVFPPNARFLAPSFALCTFAFAAGHVLFLVFAP